MAKIREGKLELLDRTLDFWQPRASRDLTHEDARQIVENVAGIFCLLQKWAQVESSAGATNETAKVLASQEEVAP